MLSRIFLFIAAFAGHASAEEEQASAEAVGIAVTLLGAVCFQMCLFYLTNHQDADMRKWTYYVINATVSIFCAVTVFTNFSDIIGLIFKNYSQTQILMINFAHFLTWYVILQVALAWVCGIFGTPPKNDAHYQLRVKSIATLLSHVTGFASINAWGTLQQLEIFSSTPLMSFAVLPISIVGQFLLQRTTDCIRSRITMADGEESEYEKMWDEECEEAENDVMGFNLSFNVTQAMRYSISNHLPNREGHESMALIISHTPGEIGSLFVFAMVWFVVLCLIYYFVSDEEVLADATIEDEETIREEIAEHREESHWSQIAERWLEIGKLTVCMSFSWCLFFGGQQSLAHIAFLQDPMILAVALTLVISALSFMAIRVLDMIADDDRTGEQIDRAIFQIIRAIALLVGFGWEQAFDEAVDALSSVAPFPHVTKFGLAMFTIVVIVPAWYHYILPMAVTEQWQWGFLADDIQKPDQEEKWAKAFEHLSKLLQDAKEAAANKSEAHNPDCKRDMLIGSLKQLKDDLQKPLLDKTTDQQWDIPNVQLPGAISREASAPPVQASISGTVRMSQSAADLEIESQKRIIQSLHEQVASLRQALGVSIDTLAVHQRVEEERTKIVETQLGGIQGMLDRVEKVETRMVPKDV